ncbi:MAG: hypothetical protein A4E40_00253 [Methanoregulaceae archaeon PtaU1.Bin059]|nr:MAG: hypothetical protein A4E40_00253 [Methanoregulaceae archaeon PtaU1.Bin059]
MKQRVGFPAGLGAHPPVPAPPPDHRREKALPGIRIAECPMDEDLDPRPILPGDRHDPVNLGERRLARHYHAGEPGPPCPFHSLSRGYRALGGRVKVKTRYHLPCKSKEPGVLDKDCIDTHPMERQEILHRIPEFLVLDERVDRDVYPHALEVCIPHCIPYLSFAEVGRKVPGPKLPPSQVYRIGPGSHRCLQCLL